MEIKEIYKEKIEISFVQFLARFKWKALQRFLFYGRFTQQKYQIVILGKRLENNLKIFTQGIGPNLLQLVHKSWENISSPTMSNNLKQ
jgi:hypothetical protein